MNQNNSVSIVTRKLMLQFKDDSSPLRHVTNITVSAVEHTNSFTQHYLSDIFRPSGSSSLLRKTFNFTRDHYTRKAVWI